VTGGSSPCHQFGYPPLQGTADPRKFHLDGHQGFFGTRQPPSAPVGLQSAAEGGKLRGAYRSGTASRCMGNGRNALSVGRRDSQSQLREAAGRLVKEHGDQLAHQPDAPVGHLYDVVEQGGIDAVTSCGRGWSRRGGNPHPGCRGTHGVVHRISAFSSCSGQTGLLR